MKTVRVALVEGDGAAPEMMAQATRVVRQAALQDGIDIEFVPTPMGWNAFEQFGDTLPKASLDAATACGLLFFGSVGDPALDKTLGAQYPDMMPEAKALLTLRKAWKLLLNFRPMVWLAELMFLSRVKVDPATIPPGGIQQHFIRYLLEDSYFGTADLINVVPEYVAEALGIKLKNQVTGDEKMVAELSYLKRGTVEAYFRYAFQYARDKGLPLICVDKANVMARFVFWRKIAQRIHDTEFPDVEMRVQLIDSGVALLVEPHKLHGVIACCNEHGDIFSDGAAAAMSSLGMMCSSAINPATGFGMFESGAGTAADLKDQDKANPLGRILTGAMLLRHIGAVKGADAIEKAALKVIAAGWRTGDIASPEDRTMRPQRIVGTQAMGALVLAHL